MTRSCYMNTASPCSKYLLIMVSLLTVLCLLFISRPVLAKPHIKGAKVCMECHEAEFKVWKGTVHFKSFRTAHREPKGKEKEKKPSPEKILEAAGGSANMKKNETCTLCHYSMEQKDESSKPVAKSGTSCESCHGASSDYLTLHDNYGGKDVKREQETEAHKAKRIEDSRKAGLIWPSMKFDVAQNCMECHGLANPNLKADILAKMLEADHPINPDFELVKYSQGTVRHRYYLPEVTVNAEMTPQELAEFFIIGQAAKLVSAVEVMNKSDNPKFRTAQEKRVTDARAALSAVKSIPQAAALIASPNEANARKLVAAIKGKDLSAAVAKLLPKKDDYK